MDSPKGRFFFKDLENIGGLLKGEIEQIMTVNLIIVLGMGGHSQAQHYCVIKERKKSETRGF